MNKERGNSKPTESITNKGVKTTVEPNKIVEVKKEIKIKKIIDVISVDIVEVEKRNENKYTRISAENYKDSYETINVKVKNGELKWAHYATEGDKGYHYFMNIKK